MDGIMDGMDGVCVVLLLCCPVPDCNAQCTVQC